MPPYLALLSTPQWLELSLSRTNFHGPKGVRAIEVRLYLATDGFCLLELISLRQIKVP